MKMGERIRRWLLCLVLALVSFLAFIADNLGVIHLGPALSVVVLCLGMTALLAMIKDF